MSFQPPRSSSLQPHLARIVEAVLFLVEEAGRRGMVVTQYDIVKSVFLADKRHLNKYGRPITFDNYVAMENGPVPSATYNILKDDAPLLRRYGKPLPWRKRAAPQINRRAYIFEHPQRTADTDVLSQSDMNELGASLTVVKSLGFQQVKRLTHEDPAYAEAWQPEGDHKQYPMNYALLFDTPDEQKAEEVSFASKHL